MTCFFVRDHFLFMAFRLGKIAPLELNVSHSLVHDKNYIEYISVEYEKPAMNNSWCIQRKPALLRQDGTEAFK